MSLFDAVFRRKRAYISIFGDGDAPDARAVLADLKRFCRYPDPPIVHDPTGAVDPIETGRLIGRQEVFNRIRSFVLTDERTFNLREETASDE